MNVCSTQIVVLLHLSDLILTTSTYGGGELTSLLMENMSESWVSHG